MTISSFSDTFHTTSNSELDIVQTRRLQHDQVELKSEKISCHKVILKIASCALFLLMTLTSFAATLYRHYQYNFTITTSTQPLKKFKKNLRVLQAYGSNSHEIGQKLLAITPKTLKIKEVVNFVFEQCRPTEVPLILNAISILRPSFTFSPYDKIRRAIVEDTQHTLNNSSLIAMLQEHQLDADPQKIIDCWDLAYRSNHPYIYCLSQTPIPSSEYSLNFLWVNLNPQDRIEDTAENIFGNGLNLSENADCIKDPTILRTFEKNEHSLTDKDLKNWKKIKKSFSYRISKWADANPDAKINLWYDSALVTQKAQQQTVEIMESISISRRVRLKLKDIRKLSNIDGEIKNSLHPGTPIYYRVDLLKALIADHMMRSPKKSPKYCIVSDIDVEPMPPQQIFDQRTLDYLSSSGYVFNRICPISNFENSFFIFNKENKHLQKIHHNTIIESTAAYITLLRQPPLGRARSPAFIGSEFIFRKYPTFENKMCESRMSGLLRCIMGESLKHTPRKVVKCPPSQFLLGCFSLSDYQKETFRFIGNSNIPYTLNGRNFNKLESEEKQIASLTEWKAEPLIP